VHVTLSAGVCVHRLAESHVRRFLRPSNARELVSSGSAVSKRLSQEPQLPDRTDLDSPLGPPAQPHQPLSVRKVTPIAVPHSPALPSRHLPSSQQQVQVPSSGMEHRYRLRPCMGPEGSPAHAGHGQRCARQQSPVPACGPRCQPSPQQQQAARRQERPALTKMRRRM